MNHCKAHRGRAKGGAQIMEGDFKASAFRIAVAVLLCCGLMLPTFSPSAKAFAEGTDSEITVPVDNEATDGVVDETAVAPEAEEVATTPEPEATNEGDVRSAAAPMADTLPAGPTISDDSISLRASSSSSTVSLDLESVPEGWGDKITGVKVAVVKDGVAGTSESLDKSQYAYDSYEWRGSTYYSIDFTRTSEKPVFTTDASDGSVKVDATNPNKLIRTYQVTVSAEGYADVQKTIEAYTQHVADGSFVLRVLDENGKVLEAKTFDAQAMQDGLVFQNGSSSCGHTGVRTFSGYGVSLSSLVSQLSTEVGAGDSVKFRVTDGTPPDYYSRWNKVWDYEELFCERYFLDSVYTDAAVKQAFIDAASQEASDAPENTAFRRAAAEATVKAGTTIDAMLSTGYQETMLDSENIASITSAPTASSVNIDKLVGKENMYRFIFGLRMVGDPMTVSFDTGDGTSVASQNVNGNLMTILPEDENTTMNSVYWAMGIDIVKDTHEAGVQRTNTVSQPENPTREGYTFGGWYTDEACTAGHEFDFSSPVSADVAEDGDTNVTLYAKWIENGSQGGTDPEPEQPTAGTKTDAATGVTASGTVLGTDGAAKDAQLKVSELATTSDRYKELKKAYAPANNLLTKVFDVTLQDANGAVITDLGADGLSISFPVGAQYNGKPGTVIHLHKNADGTVTEQRSADGQKVVDGMLTITGVKNFSEFVVMVNDDTTQAAATPTAAKTLTKTGDGIPVAPIAGLAGAGILLAAACLIMMRRKNAQR